MNDNQLNNIALKIKELGEEVRKGLGCGFPETIYQAALAVELRRNEIEYLKEVNIEIFYKNESVGVDRPDFVITKVGSYAKPIILELKAADKISDGHRVQLKSYCTSFPRNSHPALKGFAGGVLMAFPSGDMEESMRVKIFVVDRKFNVLIDEQKDEDDRLLKAKSSKKNNKL